MYEMLTGRHPFPGLSLLDLADAIRTREPDWSALPRGTPDSLQRLLARCLRKNPHDRLHDIGDARLELEELIAARTTYRRAPSGATWRIVAGLLVVLVAAGGAFLFASARRSSAASELPTLRFTQLTTAEGVEQFPAWSPDGARVVYAGESGGIRKLFVKSVGAADAQQLTSGDHDDIQPTWSADGSRVLFVRAHSARRRLEPGDVFGAYESGEGDVWSVDVASKREQPLVANAYSPDVSPDGRTIAVDATWAGPRRIWTVDARGLNPAQVTSDSSEAVAHMKPRWSPDGKRIAYQHVEPHAVRCRRRRRRHACVHRRHRRRVPEDQPCVGARRADALLLVRRPGAG